MLARKINKRTLQRKRAKIAKALRPPSTIINVPMCWQSPADTMKSWFANSSWSDLTLELSDGHYIPVHKAVLCSRNPYFNELVGLQSRMANQASKAINLRDHDPDAVKGAIRKIYGFTLDEICKIHRESKLNVVPTTPAWVFLLNLLKVSDRLRDDSLAEGVEERLWNCMVGLYTAGRHGEVTDMLHGLNDLRGRPNVMEMIVEAARLMAPHIQVLENQDLYDFLIDNPSVQNSVLERGD